ncbi:hypothetical protein SCHPADRAFT_502935 [Schizopora paradoxa]|uniref:Uncharacterized protein n=1 Tax=Schizopora paradoxa TaxID=27342 RepID=A0A0H2RFX1_9AGAM|nr:hypothetical protein SCHPADRAFT_502935 [Schizopora paradoxa]
MVNRHISIDPDRRVLARTDAAKSLRTGHELRAEVNAVDPRMVTLEGTDVVDDILSSIYVPGENPWANSGHDSKSGSSKKHFLNRIDDYVKKTLKDEPVEDALGPLRIS